MLANITRVARLAADSAADSAADTAAQAARQVVDRYAYPGGRAMYPAAMPMGRRSGGQALAVTLLLALGVLLWLASQRERMHTPARQRGKLSPTSAKPLQTWEGAGGVATPPTR